MSEKIVDPLTKTEIEITPGNREHCLGNGEHGSLGWCCDRCEHVNKCYELKPGAPENCQGNGLHPETDYEALCDTCYYHSQCFPRILHNRAKCLLCGEILESMYRHDFKTCSCGNLSVDGGHDYIRRGFEDRCAFEELSEYEERQ